MCLFVLDASVLMHDPTALFRFGEHDVYLPMAVLEEMDAARKGASESARNMREVIRILDGLIRAGGEDSIEQGLPLPVAADVPRIQADPLRTTMSTSPGVLSRKNRLFHATLIEGGGQCPHAPKACRGQQIRPADR